MYIIIVGSLERLVFSISCGIIGKIFDRQYTARKCLKEGCNDYLHKTHNYFFINKSHSRLIND